MANSNKARDREQIEAAVSHERPNIAHSTEYTGKKLERFGPTPGEAALQNAIATSLKTST
jgi:hypothetical protein